MLTGCNIFKDVETVDQDQLIEELKNRAKDGFAINYFYDEQSALPGEVWELQRFENWSRLSLHKSRKSNTIIKYKEAFEEEKYPFYVVVSKSKVELQTTSVDEVVRFFDDFGGKEKY